MKGCDSFNSIPVPLSDWVGAESDWSASETAADVLVVGVASESRVGVALVVVLSEVDVALESVPMYNIYGTDTLSHTQ